jgi:acyl carrier protein
VADINESMLLAGIAESLEVDPELISIDTVSSDLEEWDSLGHISIMSFLDKTYGEITERVPDFASATSVREVLELLKSNVEG